MAASRQKAEQHFAALEQRLGHTFRDPALLRLALTHRSHVYEARGERDPEIRNRPGTDNEQLEFLGDSVIGLAVSELLVERFPDCDEGQLTRIRAALVSRKRMAQMGAELALGDHLLLGKSAADSGVGKRSAVLANTTEAVLAAIYLDAVRSGADGLAAIRTLARELLVEPDLEAIQAAISGGARGALRDPKTLLQERVQKEHGARIRYIDTGQSGPAHDRRFTVEARLERDGATTVLASGEGASKRDAQQQAAETALQHWPPPEAQA
jgi:ribonuclease-3